MTTNKRVGRSNAPQETATDCGYVGLQAIVSTVGLFANKFIALNQLYLGLTSLGISVPLCSSVVPSEQIVLRMRL